MPARVIVPRAEPARLSRAWVGALAGFAASGLIVGSLFEGISHAFGDSDVGLGLLHLWLGAAATVVMLMFLRRRQSVRAESMRATVSVSSHDTPSPSDRTTSGTIGGTRASTA